MSTLTRTYKVGSRFRLSADALDNYGRRYAGKIYKVRSVFDHWVPVEHMQRDRTGHHGFDESAGSCLYEADGLNFALYEWEMERV